MYERTLGALDGGTVRIVSSTPVDDIFTSVAHLRLGKVGKKEQEFTAGPPEFGVQSAFDAQTATDMRLDEEYSFQGGRLRLGWGKPIIGPDGAQYWERGPDGRGRPKPLRIGIWEGSSFSLRTMVYGGESAQLLAIFEQIRVRETEKGISIAPIAYPADGFVDGPLVLQDIPGLALLDIAHLTDKVAKRVPSRRGSKVRGGELFVKAPHDHTMYFLLVGDTTRTYVIPHHGVAEDALMAAISALEVTWNTSSASSLGYLRERARVQ